VSGINWKWKENSLRKLKRKNSEIDGFKQELGELLEELEMLRS